MFRESFPRVIAAVLAFGVAAWVQAAPPENDCAGCHGKDGASTDKDVPVIGGLSEQYLLDQMAAYHDDKRPCAESKFRHGDTKRKATTMCRIAKDLGADETARIAKELAAKPFVRVKKQNFDAAKAGAGKKVHDLQCEKCHADAGSVAEDDAGILAGQHMEYMGTTFKEYDTGKRPMPVKMKAKWDKLKAEEKEALLHYYGSLQ